MLIKSFIDKETIRELLIWSETQNLYRHTSLGRYGFFSFLDELNNHPKCVNLIRQKCSNLTNAKFVEPIYKDFVNEIFIGGYVIEHTDPTVNGYKHLRCNIMLQKPQTGGQIIFNGKPVELEIGDMFLLDTSNQHAVSTVQGLLNYKTIVFGFLSDE